MSYATISDVFARYAPIYTLVGTGNLQVSSAEVASIFIADAESLIDGYLGVRYATPISPVPAMITQIASDLAIFNMLVEHLPAAPDFFQPRFDRCMDMLKMLATGDLTLGSSVSLAATGDQEAWSSTMDFHPTFDPSLADVDQTVDSDRVSEAKDTRSDDPGVDGWQ